MAFDINELDFNNAGSWPLPIRAIAIGAVSVVVMILMYFFDTKEQQKQLTVAHAQEQQLKTQLRNLHAKAVNLDAYREQMQELEKRFAGLLRQLPSATEMPALLEDISRSGLSSGLSFQSFQPRQEIKEDFYVEVPINIKVLGDYHQMGNFVSQVSNLPRIVTLHDFTIVKEKDSPLNMQILAKIYHYDESFDSQEASQQTEGEE